MDGLAYTAPGALKRSLFASSSVEGDDNSPCTVLTHWPDPVYANQKHLLADSSQLPRTGPFACFADLGAALQKWAVMALMETVRLSCDEEPQSRGGRAGESMQLNQLPLCADTVAASAAKRATRLFACPLVPALTGSAPLLVSARRVSHTGRRIG